MMVKKLYLYKLLSDPSCPSVYFDVYPGIFVSNNSSLLGMDRAIWTSSKIRDFKCNSHMKQFEVRQKRFDLLVQCADEFGIRLIRIEFSNELSDDEHDYLKKLIRTNNLQGILDFVEEQRYEFGNDIEEITFSEKKNILEDKLTLSREGVLTIYSNEVNPQEKMSIKPIKVLAGTYSPLFEEKEERKI